MTSQRGASGWRMLAIWLAMGLAGGLIGALEVYIVSDGDVLWSLAIVGLGLGLGLIIGIIFALFFSDRPVTRAASPVLTIVALAAFTVLVVLAHIYRVAGGSWLVYTLLMLVALIPGIVLLRSRRHGDH